MSYKITVADIIEFFEQNQHSSKAWYFSDEGAKQAVEELTRLRAQLAERDAMLAECSVALAYYANSQDIYQDKRVAEYAAQVLDKIPATAQANEKIIAAADAYDSAISEMEREHKRPDLYFTQHSTLLPLRQAVREKKDLKP